MLERAADMRGHVKVVNIEGLVPADHLLRKIERVVDFERVYGMVEQLYSEDNGRPEAETVAVDAGYKTPWICKKVQDDGRNLSTAYKRPMSKAGFFRGNEYVYDEHNDCVLCPNNQVLAYSTTNRDSYREFKNDPAICKSCPYINQCTQSRNHQKVVLKHIWERHVNRAADFRHSEEGKASYSLRSQTIERVFADAKEKHGMRYTMLRGLDRVRNWVRLKFAAMNLKSSQCGHGEPFQLRCSFAFSPPYAKTPLFAIR